jgi:hypothetical protein
MSDIIERLATPLLLRERPAWEVRAGHIPRLDRRWFRAHPERRHRCRWPDAVELELCDSDRRARLVMAIRHLGRGHIVYQPIIFHGDLPRDERSAAAVCARRDILRADSRRRSNGPAAAATRVASPSSQELVYAD